VLTQAGHKSEDEQVPCNLNKRLQAPKVAMPKGEMKSDYITFWAYYEPNEKGVQCVVRAEEIRACIKCPVPERIATRQRVIAKAKTNSK